MKAAQIRSYGGKNVLQIQDVDKPSITDDQVLVRVNAAGINPFDFKVREGMGRQMAELTFPATLGGDVAGVVETVGAHVTQFEIGQAVFGLAGALSGKGSFAEYTPVSSGSLALKPSNTDFVSAAALPLASVSALQAVAENIGLQKDQKILIHGGSGGIGSMAIQIAKHLGGFVATTVSESAIDFVKNLGADIIIDYQHQDFTEEIQNYDAVFDTVGGETGVKSYAVLKPEGVFVSMVDRENESLTKQYNIKYVHIFTQVTTERLQTITKLVEDNVLHVHIDKVFPFNEAAEALEYVKTGHPKGKVVIQVLQ